MDEINRFLKSRETVIEMLSDRKYTIPTELKLINSEQFKILYSKQNLDILCTHSNTLSKIYVKYIYADTKGSIIKELISDINKKYLVDNSIIFIFKSKPSISIVKILTQNKCEYFYLDMLQFNLTKHRLVSNHILMTDAEVGELLDKYKIQLNQLPIIMKNDPVVKYYNYPVGSVCKILRNSHSCIDTVFYRYVK